MPRITHVEVLYGTAVIMTAPDGNVDGQGNLTVDHPHWTLKESLAHDWAVNHKSPQLTAKGKTAVVAGGHRGGPAPDDTWEGHVRLTTFDKTARNVFTHG